MSTFLLHSNLFVCLRGFVCSPHCCHSPAERFVRFLGILLALENHTRLSFLFGENQGGPCRNVYLKESFCILENIKNKNKNPKPAALCAKISAFRSCWLQADLIECALVGFGFISFLFFFLLSIPCSSVVKFCRFFCLYQNSCQALRLGRCNHSKSSERGAAALLLFTPPDRRAKLMKSLECQAATQLVGSFENKTLK